MPARNLRTFFLVAVVAVACSWGGYLVGQNRLRLSFRNWQPAIVLNQQPDYPSEVDFSLFWTVWNKLGENYVDKTALDPQKMVDGAISGMVSALGDPYTVYLPKKQNEEAKADLNGSFEGVGIQLGFKDSRLAVVAPLEGTPAFKAGVRAGDLILNIRDEKKKVDQVTEGMTIPEAVSLIRGPKGQAVTLTLLRDGQIEPFEVELVRDQIIVKSASVELLDNDSVAHLKLNRFGDRTQEEWAETVDRLVNLPAGQLKGIILDLRNNPGGYLDGAVWVAGEFLSPGKLVVSQQYGDGTKNDLRVTRNGRLLRTKLVVLVNEGSASAAEILAGALADHKRAQVVGVNTFGKGSVQQPDDFADGSGIHITIARWLRPSGEWIDKVGIKPDMTVEDGNNDDVDLQLQEAVKLL